MTDPVTLYNNFIVPTGIYPKTSSQGPFFPEESQLQQSRATRTLFYFLNVSVCSIFCVYVVLLIMLALQTHRQRVSIFLIRRGKKKRVRTRVTNIMSPMLYQLSHPAKHRLDLVQSFCWIFRIQPDKTPYRNDCQYLSSSEDGVRLPTWWGSLRTVAQRVSTSFDSEKNPLTNCSCAPDGGSNSGLWISSRCSTN